VRFNASTHVPRPHPHGGDIGCRAAATELLRSRSRMRAATARPASSGSSQRGNFCDQTFILDYGGGSFAVGTAGRRYHRGAVDLGGQSSAIRSADRQSAAVESTWVGGNRHRGNTASFHDIRSPTSSNRGRLDMAMTLAAARQRHHGAIFPTADGVRRQWQRHPTRRRATTSSTAAPHDTFHDRRDPRLQLRSTSAQQPTPPTTHPRRSRICSTTWPRRRVRRIDNVASDSRFSRAAWATITSRTPATPDLAAGRHTITGERHDILNCDAATTLRRRLDGPRSDIHHGAPGIDTRFVRRPHHQSSSVSTRRPTAAKRARTPRSRSRRERDRRRRQRLITARRSTPLDFCDGKGGGGGGGGVGGGGGGGGFFFLFFGVIFLFFVFFLFFFCVRFCLVLLFLWGGGGATDLGGAVNDRCAAATANATLHGERPATTPRRMVSKHQRADTSLRRAGIDRH